MTEPVTIVVQGKPTPKGRPRFNRHTGSVYTPKGTARYEALVGLKANQAMAGRPLLDGPLQLNLRAHFEIPKSWPADRKTKALLGELSPGRADTDNIVKAFSDALNKIVYRDDSQIVKINATKVYAHKAFVVATVQPFSRETLPAVAGHRVPEAPETTGAG